MHSRGITIDDDIKTGMNNHSHMRAHLQISCCINSVMHQSLMIKHALQWSQSNARIPKYALVQHLALERFDSHDSKALIKR